MPAAGMNRDAKRQRTLPHIIKHMMNPMMMNPMMGGMMNPMMGGGMAPMMMGGCNHMMGPIMNGTKGGMMNPADRMNGQMMQENEEDIYDDEVGAVQDVPQPGSAAGSDVPVHAELEHEPPPVIIYNKDDDAAITRSASMIRGLVGTCMQPMLIG